MMKNSLLFTLIFLLLTGAHVFGQTPEQTPDRQAPQLVDFGASLRPGYVKKKPAPKAASANADSEVIRIDTDLVVTDVLVLNEKGLAVDGLTKDDFTIREDNASQTINTFSLGDGGKVPRSIVLIMDYSGSLLPFIKTSVAAAKVLVDQLKPDDRMAIVTDDVDLLAGFTRDRQLLKDKLDALESNIVNRKLGKSMQYSALFAALNELFGEEDIRPIVIFQTDGDEFGVLKSNYVPRVKEFAPRFPSRPEVKERSFSYDDVITAAEKARATIYTVIPGTRYTGLPAAEQIRRAKLDIENRSRIRSEIFNMPATPVPSGDDLERFAVVYAQQMLKMHQPIIHLANLSGGWAKHIETPDEAGAVYSRILSDINMRYLIGYYPTNPARDGKRRFVNIQVKNHPDYKIYARRTYYAPED